MALVDHHVVLAQLGPQVISAPPTQSYEEALRALGTPEDAIAALPETHRYQRVGAAGQGRTSNSALYISQGGIVTEVDWPCSCGAPLHAHHEFVLATWARHAGAIEGIDPDHLELHAVLEVDGKWWPAGRPRVICLCGARFESEGWIPDLDAWERHVRAA